MSVLRPPWARILTVSSVQAMTFQDAENLQRAARIMWRAWNLAGTPAERLAHAQMIARQLDAFIRNLGDANERVAARRMAGPLQLLITILESDVEATGGADHPLRARSP